MNAITQIFVCAFALLVVAVPVSAFKWSSTTKSARSHVFMSTGKTPLVANGKRFEADPGSSLIVVWA
jgi:hypothetical protein